MTHEQLYKMLNMMSDSQLELYKMRCEDDQNYNKNGD